MIISFGSIFLRDMGFDTLSKSQILGRLTFISTSLILGHVILLVKINVWNRRSLIIGCFPIVVLANLLISIAFALNSLEQPFL
jgi:hypothetical protein